MFKLQLRLLLAALLSAFMTCAVSASGAETRVALVIANAAYANAPRLQNPINDGVTVARALTSVGFTVTEQHDLSKASLERVLQDFATRAAAADVALIYYAGHGMQIGGVSYLVPIDARLQRARDVDFETVPITLVLRALEGAHRMRIAILDACRDNPLARNMMLEDGSRSAGRGLARIENLPPDTLVAYSARDGTQASDGAGANSPYATALVRNIVIPGLEINKLFRKVHDDVLKQTHRGQEPFVYGSQSQRDFYFAQPIATDEWQKEQAFWDAIEDSQNPADYEAYLAKYPNGLFAPLAKNRIKELTGAASSSDNPYPAPVPGSAYPKAIFEVTGVDVGVARSGNYITVAAKGTVRTDGWTNPQLIPLQTFAPESGMRSFTFVATPPRGAVTPAMTPIQAAIRIDSLPADVKTIRILSETNEIAQTFR